MVWKRAEEFSVSGALVAEMQLIQSEARREKGKKSNNSNFIY